MMRTIRNSLMVLVLVALASGGSWHAAAGTPHRAAPTTGSAASPGATDALPFHGTLDGVHVSRTPVAPPVVFDRFEARGQANQLGRFDVVIEATVDFGVRPVTGVGTYTFTAANGDLLVADHVGSSALVRPGTVLITEHAVIDPDRSTGRFAGAEGTFTVERLADAATGVGGRTVGTVDGTIALAVPAGGPQG